MMLLDGKKFDEAAGLLKDGKVIVFPTETSYGLGCDATNQMAVDRIFKIKGRQKNKPLLMVVPSVAMAKKYLQWNEPLEKISKKYWPGPLTVVGKIAEETKLLANGVVAADGTIAVRVTGYPPANKLSEELGGPLVATSANFSGAGDIFDADELVDIFSKQTEQPDAIIDAGQLVPQKPTTIVGVAGGQIKIIRQGEVIVQI